MKGLHCVFFSVGLTFSQFIIHFSQAQVGVQWEKTTFGDFPGFNIQDIVAATDNHYLMVGYSREDNALISDYRIIKIDLQGNRLWEKLYGGSDNDELYTAVATPDGGYLLGGASSSLASGDKSQDTRGDFDYWVIKIDADGNKEWDKTYGGPGADVLQSIVMAPEGGYLLAGTSRSGEGGEKSESSMDADPGNEFSFNVGDYWIVRIDASGDKIWDKTLGGEKREELHHVVADDQEKYLLVGASNSPVSGNKKAPRIGADESWLDYWVVQVDDEGNKQWDKSYGGTFGSIATTAIVTAEGGYMVAGYYGPPSGQNPQDPSAQVDNKIIKLDTEGNVIWEVNRGGNYDDIPTDIVETSDGNYLVVGRSNSDASRDKSEGILGRDETAEGGERPFDTWIYKINDAGEKLWDKTLAGGSDVKVVNAPEQGYILAANVIQYIRETEVVISGFRLVNADTNKDIGWLYEGDLLELQELGNPALNIRAIPAPLKVDSVVFRLTGGLRHASTERNWPYTLFGDEPGDNGRDYLGKKLRAGYRYVLTAIPYLDGYAGNEKKIDFWVTDALAIGKLEIFTYRDDHESELTDGTVIQGQFSILAKFNLTYMPDISVEFELSGPQDHTQLEQHPPYALFGDWTGYKVGTFPHLRTLPPGSYTLKATPYLFEKAGPETVVSFTVAEPEEAAHARSIEVFPVPSTGLLQLQHENIGQATL